MKFLWRNGFELCIAISGLILLSMVFLPDMMPKGMYVCLLILFLISIVLRKLTNICKNLKQEIMRGGNL